MKRPFYFLLYVSISAAAFILLRPAGQQEVYHKIPGSYKALELFSYLRAYPANDIPSDGYSKAYAYQKKYVERYAATEKTDAEWEATGPLNTAGRTLTIAVNPQDSMTLYAGSASGGLWRSRDLGRGKSWEYIPTGFPVLGVSTIAFAPGDSSAMYIGTGEVYNYSNTGNDAAFRSTRGSYGIGILKSADGGASWEKSLDWSYNQQHGVWMVQVAPSNPDIVYAATTEGVYKSLNAGGDWEKVLDVIMATDIDIDPENPDRVIAACGNFNTPGKGIYFTSDGGDRWLKSGGDIPNNFNGKILIARAPSDPQIMYASVGNGFGFNDGFTWLLRSDDGGLNWSEKNTTDYSRWQGWFSHDVAIDRQNPDKLMCVGIDIFKSTDGGESLTKKSIGGVAFGTPPVDSPDGPPAYSHSDHHFVLYHPKMEDVILFGNDGGVFLSLDDGETFQSSNGGYQSTQFYNGFSVSHLDPEFALGGLQDNSTVIYRGSGAWQRAIGGDGSWSAINQQDDNIVYGSYQYLGLNRSLNGGLGFTQLNIEFANGEDPLFISPYVVSETQPDIMYAGGVFVYKSMDKGTTWSVMNGGNPINNDPVFVMDVYPDDPDILYVATVGISKKPAVFLTTNGGESFTDISVGLPDRIPHDIIVDPQNPAVAYIVYSGFGSDHLFRTEDYGITWMSVDNGLPDVPGNAVAVDPLDPNIIYYGNDLGVYVSEDYGSSWQLLDAGLPEAIIAMDLVVSPADRKLWVATHGNGSYRIDMVSSPVAAFEEQESAIRIYPNPAQDHIFIEGAEADASWILMNGTGMEVMRGSGSKVDVTRIPAATYYLRINMPDRRIIKKVVVL